MNLLHLLVRQWRQRPTRTALSVLSVSIAVAAVLGTALAQSSVRIGTKRLLGEVDRHPALEIASASGDRFDPSTVPALNDMPEVKAQIPLVNRAGAGRIHGKRFRTVLLGLPSDQKEVWDMLKLSSGEPCRAADEVVISAKLAKGFEVELGDQLMLYTFQGPRSLTVVGLADAPALSAFAPGATIVMPLSASQELFNLGEKVDRIRVPIRAPDARTHLQAGIAARLPEGLAVQAPGDQAELTDSVLRSTELALRFSGALTLAMAAIIILNTLRMNFGERRHDVAVLRVLGTTSRQLVALHLLEGFWLGLLGSAVGIPLGWLAGRGLGHAMRQLAGGDVPPPQTSYSAILVAMVLGPIVATVAALVPALQARRVTAAEGLGDPELRRAEKFPIWAIVAGLVCWSSAAAVLVSVMLDRLAPESAIPSGLLMQVGFTVVIPALLVPIVRIFSWLLSPFLKIEGRLAAEQLLHRPTRTGLTVGVLVVALTTGLGLGNAIINNVNDVRQWYGRFMACDVFVMDPAASTGVGATERQDVRKAIISDSSVATVAELRYLPARANGTPTICIIRDFTPGIELPWAIPAHEEEQVRKQLAAGEAVVGSVLAHKSKIHVGDTLRLEIQGRVLTPRVAALVSDYTLGGAIVSVERAAAAKSIELGPAEMYLVKMKPGAAASPLVAQLNTMAKEEGLEVHSFADLRKHFDGLINGVVGALWGLLAIGFLVGGVAVANTLSMSVLEQTREFGLLRIVGMTRQQVRKMVFSEALLLGILGMLLGCIGGAVTAMSIHLTNEPLMGRWIPFTFHTWLLVANAVGCMVVVLLAGLSPGERAARLDVLAAIAYE